MSNTISGSPTIVPRESPQVNVNNSPQLIKAGGGNLYGFICENEGGSRVWIHFFDEASAGAVTLGVSVPKFSHWVDANGKFGRDPGEVPYDFFGSGVVVAITTTKTGTADPGFSITSKFWYQKQP